MKRFIWKTILFAGLFFILEKMLFVIVSYSATLEVDKRLEMVINGEINKEIIIIGSSRGARNIIARQLINETGSSAYNLSYPGSGIEFHEFVLRAIIQFNKIPKILVLTVDDPYTLYETERIRFRLDRLYPLAKYNYINQEMINRGEKTELSWLFMLSRINKRNFDLREKKFSTLDTITEFGSMPISFQKKNIDFNLDSSKNRIYSIENESMIKRDLFLKIQKQCHENNIELIICFPPNHKKFNRLFEDRLRTLSIKETRFFIYDTLNQEYKNKDLFYDKGHLKSNGAKIFTHELSEFINVIMGN